MKKIAIAAAIALASLGAQAQMYGEVGYTVTTFKGDLDGDSVKSSPSALRGIVGFELNPNLAVEGMAALGLGDAKVKFNGATIPGLKLGVTNAVGLYLKPKTKLNEQVELFGRVGYASLKAKVKVDGVGSESTEDNSFSFGAGMSYAINPSTSLNADYMQYLSKDGSKVNGFTFGVGFKF